jgi:hypothetical protein
MQWTKHVSCYAICASEVLPSQPNKGCVQLGAATHANQTLPTCMVLTWSLAAWMGGCSVGKQGREPNTPLVIVLGHLQMIVRGSYAFPGGAPKATLVDCECHWATSLVCRSCGVQRVDEVRATPLSRRTTKCWSTQQGLACRQAREPRPHSIVIDSLDFSRWLVFILLWLVHSSTRRYKDHIPLIYILIN